MNIFERVIEIFLAAFAFFIIPYLIFELIYVQLLQIYVSSYAESFAENCYNRQYISSEMYHDLVMTVKKPDETTTLDINVSRLEYEPVYTNENGEIIFSGKVVEYFDNYITGEIEKHICTGVPFELRKGDYITVTATIMNHGIVNRIFSAIFKNEIGYIYVEQGCTI